ncbi:histidine phosphatase family protein [Knoellia sp. 3-2P3]|uniref:histidine phosphatase family protein n=1 Tax=unclassified Knoellia TaxID=2618719 RepID=UPI0023DA8D8E|nr:histidine phosphatase family protein [Knoellia sp. 3-2P3]MDF2092518.1 histidine phosphatase family protein [Knoellia sp. 3-2P3]
MADLQCPARIILARHGDAATPDGGGPRLLTPTGVNQSEQLAERVFEMRVAALWASTMERAQQTASVVSERLGLPVVSDDRLRELINDERWTPPLCDKDEPGDVYAAWLEGDLDGTIFGETGHDVIARLRDVVEEVADLFRGESVLLVSHGGIIELGLSHLCRNVTASFVDRHPLGNGEAVEVEVDSSGWVCTSWAGKPLPLLL